MFRQIYFVTMPTGSDAGQHFVYSNRYMVSAWQFLTVKDQKRQCKHKDAEEDHDVKELLDVWEYAYSVWSSPAPVYPIMIFDKQETNGTSSRTSSSNIYCFQKIKKWWIKITKFWNPFLNPQHGAQIFLKISASLRRYHLEQNTHTLWAKLSARCWNYMAAP